MADRIVVLNAGRIEQVGSPLELYARPANLFVARFLGAPPMNLLAGQVASIKGAAGIRLDCGAEIALPERVAELPAGLPVTLGIRPEHCEIHGSDLQARVLSTEILGSETIMHAEIDGGQGFTLAQRGIAGAAWGDRLGLRLPAAFIHVFDREGRVIAPAGDWREAYVR